ncbi:MULTISPECIES: FecR family protein [unclassified Saccharicrinis]|uniref:FecR family protein n=1 Tax=unclassified Saccharicrinis TaxID=2646859 RepID=UPI003D343348
MNKEIYQKYLNNSCSEQEFEEFTKWINKDALSKEGMEWGFDNWEHHNLQTTTKNKGKYLTILDKIHHRINLLEEKYVPGNPSSLHRIYIWISRIAAVLFIPLLGLVLYLLTANNYPFERSAINAVDSLEIIAPIGSRAVLQLTDGTEVNLNYGSRLKYPRNFTGDSREVKLIGEAYFEVAHNPEKPFIVKTNNLSIKALGTAFNVNAYPGAKYVSTTLVDGKVALEHDLINRSQSIGTMIPSQHVAYNTKSGEIFSSMGSVEKYIGWKDGKLIFDNEPIDHVADRLARMFNVDIEVDDNVNEYTYTVTFVDEPLFLILDLMTEITPIEYKIHPRKKLANGTYSKQRIQILKR